MQRGNVGTGARQGDKGCAAQALPKGTVLNVCLVL